MNDLSIDNERENKIKAWLLSFLVYGILLALLILFKINYTPKEEPMAMGVDLNYGVDLVGYGDLQTTNKANDSKINEEMAPQEEKAQESKPQVQEEAASAAPVKTQRVAKTPPVLSSANSESKVTAKKSVDPVKPAVKASVPSTSTAKVSKPAAPAPERKVDQGSLFKKGGSASNSNGTTGTKTGIGGNNNGNGKPGDVGDQGDPRGTLDGKSLYGNPGKGGAGGASVNISGWKKSKLSIPKDNSSEIGKIVFSVTVDDTGDVVGISTKESSVSPSVTNFYKNYLKNKLSSFLRPEGRPPARSSGTITIYITRES